MCERLMFGLQSMLVFPVLCSLFELGSHLCPLVCPGPLTAIIIIIIIIIIVITQLLTGMNFLWGLKM